MNWMAAGLSLLGNVLLIRKNRLGFLCWLVANVYWVIHNLAIVEYAQAVMFAVYGGLAIWGLLAWKNAELRMNNE